MDETRLAEIEKEHQINFQLGRQDDAVPELIDALREAQETIEEITHHREQLRADRDRLAAQIERVRAVIDAVDPTKSATVMTSAIRAALDDPEPRRGEAGGDE